MPAPPPDNLLAQVLVPIRQGIDEAVAKHQALPPRLKNLARARMGAWILAAEIYVAWRGWPLVAGLFEAFFRAPAAAPPEIGLPVAILAGITFLGTMWLVVGIAGSRGPRDSMMIFWTLVRVGIAVGLITGNVYFPDATNNGTLAANFVLHVLYVAGLAGYGLELVLLVQGPPRMPKHSNVHGHSRLATAADLRRKGILE